MNYIQFWYQILPHVFNKKMKTNILRFVHKLWSYQCLNFRSDALKMTSSEWKRQKLPKLYSESIGFYFILYNETQCISKLDKIGIFIDMKFH